MYSYHIKDSFFTDIEQALGTKNTHLMSNKENEGYRPHFLCVKDARNPNIYWAVPQSTKVEKYKNQIKIKKEKYGHCDTIVIGLFAQKENAFLIQNMFPITQNYIDHVHTIDGNAVAIHKNLEKKIISKVKKVLKAKNRGIKLVFPDIDAIYNFLQNK